MASLFNKVVQFANSPKGKEAIRQATDKAQQLAKDPKTRAKLDDVRRRVQGGRGGHGTGTDGSGGVRCPAELRLTALAPRPGRAPSARRGAGRRWSPRRCRRPAPAS